MIPLKNQEFLIRLLPKIKEYVPRAHLILLGKGETKELDRLKHIASECNVSDSVRFCGAVMNVNEWLSAVDVFAFPSKREGTPLALIEAQANGLPCIISDRIPNDAILTDLVQPVSLEDEVAWCSALMNAHRKAPEQYASIIEKAGYNMKTSYQPIYGIYRGESSGKRR